MRTLLIGLGIFVVALVVLAVVVPLLIPADTYRDRIVAATESATGRKIHINGRVRLSLLPSLAVEANDVALDNAPGGAAKEMATFAKLQVGMKLLPLIGGDIEISRFVLTDPVIHLEIAKDGRPNWQFGPAEVAPSQPAASAAPAPAASRQSDSLRALRLGQVKLVNGTVDYFDARTNARYAADQIGITVSLPSLDEKSTIDGSVTWQGKPVKLSFVADRPRALLGEGNSALKLSVTSDPVDFAFDGTMTGGAPSKLEGTLSVESGSVRDLSTWAGSPPPVGGDGLGKFSLKGKLVSAGPSVSFSDIALNVDSLKAGGSLAIDGSGTVPTITGALTVNRIDVNPYLVRPARAPALAPAEPAATPALAPAEPATTPAAAPAPPAAVPPSPPAGSRQWSDAPIDLSALKGVNADLTIAADGVRYGKIEIGKTTLAIALEGGKLTLGLNEIQLYGGDGKGQVVVDGSGAAPALSLGFALKGVKVEPLLSAAIDLDRVTGAGQLDFDLASRGRSQRDLMDGLSGKGAFSFANGAIKGIDLTAMAKNVGQAFLAAASGSAQQTAFSAFGGTFTVASGIVHNSDLTLKSPVTQLTGAGTVDLPRRTIDYRIEPNVEIASQDIAVPIVISGPLDKPSYRPDITAALTKNAGKLLQGAAGLGGKPAAGLLQGLLGR